MTQHLSYINECTSPKPWWAENQRIFHCCHCTRNANEVWYNFCARNPKFAFLVSFYLVNKNDIWDDGLTSKISSSLTNGNLDKNSIAEGCDSVWNKHKCACIRNPALCSLCLCVCVCVCVLTNLWNKVSLYTDALRLGVAGISVSIHKNF